MRRDIKIVSFTVKIDEINKNENVLNPEKCMLAKKQKNRTAF